MRRDPRDLSFAGQPVKEEIVSSRTVFTQKKFNFSLFCCSLRGIRVWHPQQQRRKNVEKLTPSRSGAEEGRMATMKVERQASETA
jgi:hypothetical protein